MKSAPVLVAFLFLCTLALGQGHKIERLRDVHKIYVKNLGESEGANVIREKLINRLIKSDRLVVVESADDADAVLTGIAERSVPGGSVHANANSASGSYGTRYDATLVVRLITRDKRILWVGEAKPGFLSGSVSSSVADKVSKDLLNAIKKDEKRKDR